MMAIADDGDDDDDDDDGDGGSCDGSDDKNEIIVVHSYLAFICCWTNHFIFLVI